jgi:hypothetical protein
VASKFNDLRNSSFFKSFETKLGSAVNNVCWEFYTSGFHDRTFQAKMVASTSIDHLAGVAGGSRPSTAHNGATGAGSDGAAAANNNASSPLS